MRLLGTICATTWERLPLKETKTEQGSTEERKPEAQQDSSSKCFWMGQTAETTQQFVKVPECSVTTADL